MKAVQIPFICFIFCLAFFVGVAQQLPHTADQFGKAEGLTVTPNCMTQDDDGFLWLGTQNGLFRFDGVHAAKINYLPSDTLPQQASKIYDLSFDPQKNVLWIGTSHGIFRYDLSTGKALHLLPKDFFEEKTIANNGSRVIFTDRQGEVWANFGIYGLVHLLDDGKKAETFFLPLTDREKAAGLDGNRANNITMIAQDANDDNVLWITTTRGFLRFDKAGKRLRRFVFYPQKDGMLLDANSMNCVFPHKNGLIYIGSWDMGLLKFDPRTETFTPFFLNKKGWNPTNNTNRVSNLVAADGGHLWADCGDGGSRLFDVEKEQFITENEPGFSIDYQDRNGHFWQFKSGLRMFHRQKNQLERHPYPASLQCVAQSELPFDSTARQVFMRARCQNGVWAMNVDDGTWTQYSLPGMEEGQLGITSYCQSPDGFFITSERHKLYFRANGSAAFQSVPAEIPADIGHPNIAARPDGHFFVTGHEGWLLWFKPGSWRPVIIGKVNVGEPSPDFFSCNSSPSFDHKGRLWMRTCNGFSIFSPVTKDSFGEENRFIHVSKKGKGLHLQSYDSFKMDSHGRMWASGSGGVGWLDPDRPEVGLQKKYGPEEGFPFAHTNIVFFEKGKIWLLIQQGLVEFDPGTEKYRLFEFIQTGSSGTVSLGDGRGLMFRGDGYTFFKIDSLQEIKETPRPYLSWFKVFEQPKQLPGSLFLPQKISLLPDENFFSVGFSALAWYDPEKIKFAYKLEGVNRDWVYPEQGVLATSFTNIEGGDYVFKVKTTNHRGEWLDNVFQLNIHVGTPWYKTWWFRLAVMAAMAASVYFLVKNRLYRQKMQLENQRLQLEKEQSLRMERDRIAAEMHDELGAGLSTIRFLSLAAKEKETDPAIAARIDKIANHAARVMEKMADIIWVMNSRNDSLENFAAYLRRYAGELLETHGIRLIFEMTPDLPPKILSGEQRRTLLLAVKECLHNVVKHAGATEARLTIEANGALEIIVQDNGRGIPPQILDEMNNGGNSLTGNGLRNIQMRMAALGGEAVFESGQGTKVLLHTRISAG